MYIAQSTSMSSNYIEIHICKWHLASAPDNIFLILFRCFFFLSLSPHWFCGTQHYSQSSDMFAVEEKMMCHLINIFWWKHTITKMNFLLYGHIQKKNHAGMLHAFQSIFVNYYFECVWWASIHSGTQRINCALEALTNFHMKCIRLINAIEFVSSICWPRIDRTHFQM